VPTIQPILLLADSQLLFHRDDSGHPFGDRVREWLETPPAGAKAAYLGASNGDQPEYFELFAGAMAQVGLTDCRMIPSRPLAEDLDFLAVADLVLLAGGEVRRGWEVLTENGVAGRLPELHWSGALLVGVSAGAVQLGLFGWDEESGEPFPVSRLVPLLVDAHDEPAWERLTRAVQRCDGLVRGLGIPSGGGVVYHPDASLEPLRYPAVELAPGEEGEAGLRQTLLLPGAPAPS